MRQPEISIVVPAYNCERYLAKTLASILAQSFRNWECVIVDDGSPDGTAEIARAYADQDDRFQFFSRANAGPCAARNFGFGRISPSSRYVTFMDADDLWLPETLEILKDTLDRNPSVVGAHGLGEFIDSEGNPTLPGWFSEFGRKRLGFRDGRIVEWPRDRPTCFATLVTASVTYPPGLILTRREYLAEAGLFDEKMRYAEDWDLLIRLSRFGDFAFLDRVVLLYRRHESNVGASSAVPEAAWRVRCRTFFSDLNTDEHRRILRGSWRAYQIRLVRERAAAAASHFKKGGIGPALNSLARIPVCWFRYARGYPTPVIR